MKKSVWLTLLEKDESWAKELYQSIKQYGLQAEGHFWVDDLEKMAWAGALDSLAKDNLGLWLIAGKAESLAQESVRYGLSLLTLALSGRRQGYLPSIMIMPRSELNDEALPTALAGSEVLDPQAKLGPKLAARANMPGSRVDSAYRLTVHPLTGLGPWFELGPAPGDEWSGAMFGLDSGEIRAHGVGQAGKVPEKAVLEYQMQGITLQADQKQFTAWAVKNKLTNSDSYYLQVKGMPQEILFGSFSEGQDAEMFRLKLY
ncbi:MAG: hypothetical protein ACOC43_02545 [Desulfohalobiaceae bacterium]